MTHETGFSIQTIQAGMPIVYREEVPTIAVVDHLQIGLIADGTTIASGLLTADQALVFANALSRAARDLIAAEVDDRGKPLDFFSRLARLTTAGRSS